MCDCYRYVAHAAAYSLFVFYYRRGLSVFRGNAREPLQNWWHDWAMSNVRVDGNIACVHTLIAFCVHTHFTVLLFVLPLHLHAHSIGANLCTCICTPSKRVVNVAGNRDLIMRDSRLGCVRTFRGVAVFVVFFVCDMKCMRVIDSDAKHLMNLSFGWFICLIVWTSVFSYSIITTLSVSGLSCCMQLDVHSKIIQTHRHEMSVWMSIRCTNVGTCSSRRCVDYEPYSMASRCDDYDDEFVWVWIMLMCVLAVIKPAPLSSCRWHYRHNHHHRWSPLDVLWRRLADSSSHTVRRTVNHNASSVGPENRTVSQTLIMLIRISVRRYVCAVWTIADADYRASIMTPLDGESECGVGDGYGDNSAGGGSGGVDNNDMSTIMTTECRRCCVSVTECGAMNAPTIDQCTANLSIRIGGIETGRLWCVVFLIDEHC